MLMSPQLWMAGLLGLSLGVSFLLSGMEAGVFALSRLRIRQQMRAGNPSARLLYGFLENPEDFLWTILVGNTVANFGSFCLLFMLVHRWLARWPIGFAAALLVLTLVVYALADLLPKMLFRQFPNRLCLRLAQPFRLVHLTLAPAVSLVTRAADLLLRFTGARRFTGRLFGNREELRLVMQENAQALTPDERRMVSRVMDLQAVTAGAITVPFSRVVATAAGRPLAEVLQLCRQTGYMRVPVRDERTGRVSGILSLRRVLYREGLDPGRNAGAFVHPALFLDASLRLEVALQRFRQTGERMAIVLDRSRGEIGILTLQDILRFIFGEVSL